MTLPFENNLINNRYGLSDQSMNNEWSWTKPLGLAIVVSLHIGEVRGQSRLFSGMGHLLPMPISVSASDSCREQLETNLLRRAAQPWKESTEKVIFANLIEL